MGLFNKENIENEAITLAEKAAGRVFDKFVASGASAPSPTPVTTGLASVIIEAVTNHVAQGGVAPDVNLLKTSIGQLIEGTVGLLQATGKITPAQASKAEVVAQAVQGAMVSELKSNSAPTVTVANAPKIPTVGSGS